MAIEYRVKESLEPISEWKTIIHRFQQDIPFQPDEFESIEGMLEDWGYTELSLTRRDGRYVEARRVYK